MLLTLSFTDQKFLIVIKFSLSIFISWVLSDGISKKSFSSVSSVTQSCPILCHPMDCSMLGLPVHPQLPEFTQIHVHWVSDVIQPSHPLSSLPSPDFSLSQHQGLFQWVSSNESGFFPMCQYFGQKFWSFSFSISPSNEYSALISFRMDWLDLLAVQGTL